MKRVPAALAIALVGGWLASLVLRGLVTFHEWRGEHTLDAIYQVWSLVAVAEALLMLVGAVALARAVASGLPRALANVAIAASAVALAASLFWQWIVPVWHPDFEPGHTFAQVQHALEWIVPIAYVAVYGAIAAVGMRAAPPESHVIPIAVAAMQLVRDPIPPLANALDIRSPTTGFVVHAALYTAIVAGALYGASREAAPRNVGWSPAARGLGRAATALAWRVGVTVALIPLFLLAYLARSEGLAKLLAIGVPTGLVISGAVAIASLLQASHGDADGAPRLRLAGAAGLLAMGATFDVLSLVNAFIVVFGLHVRLVYELHQLGPLLWLVPAIGVAGMLVFLAALGAIAARVQAGVDPARVAGVAATIASVTLAVLWVLHAALSDEAPSMGGLATVAVIAAVVSVSCAIIVVRMTRAVAAALGGAPSLPTAIAKLS